LARCGEIVRKKLKRRQALPGFLIRGSAAPDDEIDGKLSGEEAGRTVWTARPPQRLRTHADNEFAPVHCAAGGPSAFVPHRIVRPWG